MINNMGDLLSLNEAELTAIGLSLKVAIYTCIFSLPPALFIAYKMARSNFFLKPIVESIINLPLVMPPVATGYLLLISLGANSTIGIFLNDLFGIKIAFSFSAAVIAAIVVSFPLMLRSIRTSIEMVDFGLEEASRILGVNRFMTFIKITLPLSMPGVISGSILAFARSLGEFGATISFAGNIEGETQTLPLAIYSNMQTPGKELITFKLVIVSVIISLIAMILSEWYIKKMKHDRA